MAMTGSGSAIEQEPWLVRLSVAHGALGALGALGPPGRTTVAMSLDEIDAAFHAGTIDAKTQVRAPGAQHFTTLGEAAGLDAGDPEAPYSLAPMAADVGPASAASLGTFQALDEDDVAPALARPRRVGRAGRVIGVVLMFVVLIAVGMGGGAYAARPAEARATLTELRGKVGAWRAGRADRADRSGRAGAAQPPPKAVEAPVVPVTPPPSPPSPPARASASTSASGAPTTVDSLPNASVKGAKVKGKAAAPAKSKPRK